MSNFSTDKKKLTARWVGTILLTFMACLSSACQGVAIHNPTQTPFVDSAGQISTIVISATSSPTKILPTNTLRALNTPTETLAPFPPWYHDSAHAVLDWRRYTVDGYGFSFIYQKDWSVNAVDSHHLQILYKDAVLSIGYRHPQEAIILAPLVNVHGLAPGNSIDFLGEPITLLDDVRRDQITTSGVEWKAHYYDLGGEINRGDLVFTLRLQPLDEKKSLTDIASGEMALFDVIISSFEVIPDRITQAVGTQINLARSALSDTQSIEIGLFNPFLGGSAYLYLHLINNPEVISRVIKSLDQVAMVKPTPDCVAAYKLAFNLSDGRKIIFNYVCDSQVSGLMNGTASDHSIAIPGMIPVSNEFIESLASPLAQAETLRDNNQLPLWKTRIAQTSRKAGPFTLDDYAILDPGRYSPSSTEFKAIIPDEVFAKWASSRGLPGNGTGFPIPAIKAAGHSVEVVETWPAETPDNFAVVHSDGKEIFRISIRPPAGTPAIHGLWEWDGHWVLEVEDHVIIDGQELNARLGAQATFGWQLMDGKPFALMIKDNGVNAWYADQIIPLGYTEIVHNQCCEASLFNLGHNSKMVWFYARKGSQWHYVEMRVD